MRIPKPLRLVREATRVGQKMAEKPATPCCLAVRSPTSSYLFPLVKMSWRVHALDAGKSFKWRWTIACWKMKKKEKERRQRRRRKKTMFNLTIWAFKFFFSSFKITLLPFIKWVEKSNCPPFI